MDDKILSMVAIADLAPRMDALINSPTPDACWLWQGSVNEHGYGIVQWKEARALGIKYAHRIVWAINVGPIPDGKIIMHSCDNPPCCNPAHLFLGTRTDNMIDKYVKGRARPGRHHLTHCPRGHELTGANLRIKFKRGPHGDIYETRNCRICQRELQQLRRARKATA